MNQAISPKHPVAYFCAEYGLEANLPIYAGGLGVLAGDTLKAAVDADFPIVGVGLLYRGEDAAQRIDSDGMQTEENIPVDPLTLGLEHVDVDGHPLFIQVHLTNVTIWMHCWRKRLSENVTLYLLDTETEQNHFNERKISHALYCGSDEDQFRQQLLLGIGGVKLLHSLNIHPEVYHLNEGRPVFLHWQLIRSYMDFHGMSYTQAKDHARQKTVYTNHTLVGAGNPGYPASLIATYAQYYADKMGVPVSALLKDGIDHDPDHFQITRAALNVSRQANGVSQLHTQFSQETWPEYNWTAITNGVHMPTWQRRNVADQVDDDHGLWESHLRAKRDLAEFVHYQSGYRFDPNRLIISWARRITAYKQLPVLFTDLERLALLLRNPDRPIQLLVGGKAHFGDSEAKMVIQEIIHKFAGELSGHALFVPDYNLDVARYMVQGSDVWLNTPEYGKEASGTSGMKALANGVLSLSVADGWVPELDWEDKGWIIDHSRVAESVYELLEQQIAPLYYDRNEAGLPVGWLSKMRQSIKSAPQFSAERMLAEYREKLYAKS